MLYAGADLQPLTSDKIDCIAVAGNQANAVRANSPVMAAPQRAAAMQLQVSALS